MKRELQPQRHPILTVKNVSKTYFVRTASWGRRAIVQALCQVALTVARGTALAIVGQSGAGKSTLARCMAGLEQPDSGEIRFLDEHPLLRSNCTADHFHRQVQLVLQDAATALNPRFTAAEIVAEPLVIQHIGTRKERKERVLALLNDVGLGAAFSDRLPHHLSGGQRQRLAIARALALEPCLLVLDEAFNGLDLRVQKQIAALLLDLQQRRGLTLTFISHDLRLMAMVAEHIAIMHQGKIVESGLTADVLAFPSHPHTQALVACASLNLSRVAVQGAPA